MKPFDLKILTALIAQATILGINADDLVEFLWLQAHEMLKYKPNYQLGGPVWILRGYYPETSLFFKLTIVERRETLYAKASHLKIRLRSKPYDDYFIAQNSEMIKYTTQKMENTLLGANHKVESLLPKKFKRPKCISPKGMTLFKYKPKREKKRAK